jgi:hypothetical protein
MSFMLSVTKRPFMLSVIMLNVVMLSVVMLNVVAPLSLLRRGGASVKQRSLEVIYHILLVHQFFLSSKL